MEQSKIDDNLLDKIKIIKETDDYLVINKPAGILVHPDRVHQEPTLVDWLIKKYPQIKKVYDRQNKTGDLRPGIVHRLDREVSGLLVIAKNQKMFDYLKKQFQQREIKKEYITLVHGLIKPDEGQILRPIARSRKTGLMIARGGKNEQGKTALTQFEVIQRLKNYTLLKINLKTGRTHQIRVHLKSIGHSIVGDKLYQTRNIKIKKAHLGFDKPFLTATLLGFYDLKNNWQEFKIELPKELLSWVLKPSLTEQIYDSRKMVRLKRQN